MHLRNSTKLIFSEKYNLNFCISYEYQWKITEQSKLLSNLLFKKSTLFCAADKKYIMALDNEGFISLSLIFSICFLCYSHALQCWKQNKRHSIVFRRKNDARMNVRLRVSFCKDFQMTINFKISWILFPLLLLDIPWSKKNFLFYFIVVIMFFQQTNWSHRWSTGSNSIYYFVGDSSTNCIKRIGKTRRILSLLFL